MCIDAVSSKLIVNTQPSSEAETCLSVLAIYVIFQTSHIVYIKKIEIIRYYALGMYKKLCVTQSCE